jgi:hypothetical protein
VMLTTLAAVFVVFAQMPECDSHSNAISPSSPMIVFAQRRICRLEI